MRHLFVFILFYSCVYAQDSTETAKKITLNGYVKNLQSISFDKDFRHAVSGNLLHNRLNLKAKLTTRLSAAAEIRTRLFWGEEMKITPHFVSMLENNNEKIRMQKVWINNESLALVSNVERLYLDFQKNDITIRVGRQRINWGVTTNWNPNDIFNAYNFLDFDYEERPGVDGGKVHYNLSGNSNAEVAFAFAGKKKQVAALKYFLNKWNYDMQLLLGWYKQQATAGGGWAGNIGDAGFKGEFQYFFAAADLTDRFNLAVEADNMFENGWYLNGGFLMNNRGLTKPAGNWNEIDLNLSPDNLMPAKWNILLTTAKEIDPLFSLDMSVVYSPGPDLLILLPAVTYNMAPNLDVNLFAQSFFAKMNAGFQAMNHRMYLRLKWSF